MAVNRYYSSNAIDTTLTTGIDASTTEIVLASTSGMPQSYPFTLALDYDTASEELVNVVGVGSIANSFKVGSTVGIASVTGRGVDGNAATTHAAGAPVKHVISARDIREAQVHIDASTKYTVTSGSITTDVNLHGIADGEGSVVGTAKTQTLTNKTMSGASNTFNSIAQSSITNLTSDLALKAPLASPTFTGTVTLPTGTVSTTMIADSAVTSSKIADGTIVNADINSSAAIDWTKLAISSTVSATEIGYVDGVTSAIQTQIDNVIASLSSAVPTGTLSMYAGSTAPTGYLICNGTAVSRTTYAALFGIVSTDYGAGDGSTTFNLPDLRGRAPIGAGTGTGLTARALGATVGNETVTLTPAQMPIHTHGFFFSGSGPASGGISTVSGQSFQGNSTSAGGDQPHPNMQPSLAVNFIIKH
jgi:microcystin-dependent protein